MMFAALLLMSVVSSANGILKELDELYYHGDYENVIKKADSLLLKDANMDKGFSIKLHEYVGFSYVALDRNDEARVEFLSMLELDSTLTLDPLKVSPKIVQVFEETRSLFPRPFVLSAGDSSSALRLNVPKDTSRTGSLLSFRKALLYSTLFPGAGQVYSANKPLGWSFMIAEGLSVAGLLASQICMSKARDAYVEATEPGDIEAKYALYNDLYCTRNALVGLSIGIWVTAPLELVLFPPDWAKNR
jgi:hypothetical protein